MNSINKLKLKNYKLIESYVKAKLNEQGILGKYLWSSADRNHPFPNDPDTEIEERLYKELHYHFGGKASLSDVAIKAIKKILDSGEHSNIFKRCEEGKILRGIRLSINWLEEYAPEVLDSLPELRQEVDTVNWDSPIPIKSFAYPGTDGFGQVSSWTAHWDEARRFTRQWSPDTVPVILHSDCSSGYFMQTWPFNRFKGGRYKKEFGIKKLNPNAHENEILLFDDCVVTAIQVNSSKEEVSKLKKL